MGRPREIYRVRLEDDDAHRLMGAAYARRTSEDELLNRIVLTVLRHDLIKAVLDDDGQPGD
jgi:hypothetical protein